MNSIRLNPRLAKVAFALSLPITVSEAKAVNSDQKNKSEGSWMVKPSKLPLYEEPKDLYSYEYFGQEKTKMEETIGLMRKEVESVYEGTKESRESFAHVVETGKAHSMVTLNYLLDEENTTGRVGAVALAGLVGLLVGGRSKFKKLLTGSVGAAGVASLLYPKEALQISSELADNAAVYTNVAYNFIVGAKPSLDDTKQLDTGTTTAKEDKVKSDRSGSRFRENDSSFEDFRRKWRKFLNRFRYEDRNAEMDLNSSFENDQNSRTNQKNGSETNESENILKSENLDSDSELTSSRNSHFSSPEIQTFVISKNPELDLAGVESQTMPSTSSNPEDVFDKLIDSMLNIRIHPSELSETIKEGPETHQKREEFLQNTPELDLDNELDISEENVKDINEMDSFIQEDPALEIKESSEPSKVEQETLETEGQGHSVVPRFTRNVPLLSEGTSPKFEAAPSGSLNPQASSKDIKKAESSSSSPKITKTVESKSSSLQGDFGQANPEDKDMYTTRS